MRGPAIGAARLPYPDLPLLLRMAIERAIRWAWSELCADPSGTAPNPRIASEDQISADIQRRLNQRPNGTLELSRFTGTLMETVQRAGHYFNYSGASVNRAPDLVFRPIDIPVQVENATDYALFVECKIVDGTHPLGLYVSKGLRRFVAGDYAWAMSNALMVAYVRNGTTIEPHLVARLKKRYRTEELPVVRDDGGTEPTFVSRHSRPLVHPPSGQPLGAIEVAHVWLTLQ